MNKKKERTKKYVYAAEDGRKAYDTYWEKQMKNPDFRNVYAEESKKKALWLQLAQARQEAGLTQAEVAKRMGVSQAQVARIEKRGYGAYTLRTLHRYVNALDEKFDLEIVIRKSNWPYKHGVSI